MTTIQKQRIDNIITYANSMIEVHKYMPFDRSILIEALEALVMRAELIMRGAV